LSAQSWLSRTPKSAHDYALNEGGR
jgi:hypothetical protein